MNRGTFILAAILMAACSASAMGREPGFAEYRVVQDSFGHLPPNMRFYALRKAGLLPPPAHTASVDTGSGLRLVGKLGGGPSVKVTGRDSLVFLSRGSEVVAINFADTANPRILSYIQAQGLVSRSVLVGNRLYVGSTGSDPKYVEVFDVTDPANAVKLGSVQTMLNDIAVKDTLVYTVSDDSFKVFNFANAACPTLVGACRDSGYTISVNNGYAYLGDRWGLYVIDATNPASPHRVALWGSDVISVTARNTICCVTLGNPNQPTWLRFTVLDIAAPSLPMPLGSVDSCGGYDIFLKDSLAFLSGYYTGGHEFRAVCIADSTHPLALGQCRTDGQNSGVWAAPGHGLACVADGWSGLATVDISSLGSPILDTVALKADQAQDIWVDDSIAYVADYRAGLKLLDVSNPAVPNEIGCMDTIIGTSTFSCVARDSFAYMGWANPPPFLRAIDVTDPTRPSMAGGSTVFDRPQDMVLRDSLLYVAQRVRFQIINVARPRAPVLVGSCVLPDESNDLWLSDTTAYVGNLGLVMVSVANPAAPRILGTWSGEALGVAVRDTVAYVACVGSFVTLNVANPASPRTLDSLPANELLYDVVLVDTLAYAGGKLLHVFNVADPANVREVTTWIPPYSIRRLEYAPPFVYVACYEAGVCILDTLAVGMAETPASALRSPPGLSVTPNPAHDRIALHGARELSEVVLRDVSGREARRVLLNSGTTAVSLVGLQPGIYLCSIVVGGKRETVKLIKR